MNYSIETGSGGNDDFRIHIGGAWSTPAVQINNDGTIAFMQKNVGVKTTTFGTSAVGVLGIANGTAPTSSPANMIQLYAEDAAASSELKVRDEAGNITVLSPHNFTMFTPDALDIYPWSFYHENPYLGKRMAIDMSRLVRAVEELSGRQLSYVEDLPAEKVENWDANQRELVAQREAEILEAIDAGNTPPDPYVEKPMPAWLASRVRTV